MSEHQSTSPSGTGAFLTWADRTSRALVSSYQPNALDPGSAPSLADAEYLLSLLPDNALPDAAPLPPGSYLPGQPDIAFVGRTTELRTLAHALKQPAHAAAICGPGGMGKTQLALAFAAHYGQFFAGGVCWISFAQPASISAEVAASGAGLNLHPGFANLPLRERVRLVVAAWHKPMPRLLIFDGCEEPHLLHEWWPDGGGCHILLTSRQETHNLPPIARRLTLTALPRPDSQAILSAALNGNAPPDITDLDALAAELDDLPLALRLAAACLHRCPDLQHDAYLARLRDLPPTRGAVARAAALSYQQLAEGTLRDLLARALCCAWDEPIPRSLLLAGLPDEAPDALDTLLSLGLLTSEPDGAPVLHSLLAACIEPYADTEAARPHVEAALREALTAAAVQPQIMPHLHAAVVVARQRHDEPAAALCHHLGQHLKQTGDRAAAAPLLEHALATREHLLGEQHPDSLSSLALLADLRREQGDYAAALPLFAQLLARHEATSGPWHLRTAVTLTTLGGLHREQGDYTAAAALFARALAIREQRLGLWHPRVATSLAHLAEIRTLQGNQHAAHRLSERARFIRGQALGLRLPQLVVSLTRMADIYEQQHDYEAARSLLAQALGIIEQTLGANHPHIATHLTNMARLLHLQHDPDGARALLERALVIDETIYGPEHPEVATCLNNLAGLLYTSGESAQARPLLERARDICEQALEPQHLDTANTLHNLAVVQFEEAEPGLATDLMRRALHIRRAALGEEHPDTRNSRQSLAAIEAALA